MMNEIINEIIRLREELDEIWKLLENTGGISDTSGTQSHDADSHYRRRNRSNIEYRLGISMARLAKSGWRSAIRPWIDSPRIRNDILKSFGLSPGSFMGGMIGGFYGIAVSAILDGLKKLFRKKRSPLLKAIEPEEIQYVFPDDYPSGFNRNIQSELIRGRRARLMSREDFLRNEPLARQLQRGVVGL